MQPIAITGMTLPALATSTALILVCGSQSASAQHVHSPTHHLAIDTDTVDGHSGYGGIHAPHYPGVPHHAKHVVAFHDGHELVVLYVLGNHYHCVHDGISTEIRFGEQAHVPEIALGLEQTMNLACDDMQANYRRNPGFNVTSEEMHEFEDCAGKLQEYSRTGNLKSAAAQLDHFTEDFDHLAVDVRNWHRDPIQQVGRGGLLTKLDDMHSMILHLSNAMGVRTPHDPLQGHHHHHP